MKKHATARQRGSRKATVAFLMLLSIFNGNLSQAVNPKDNIIACITALRNPSAKIPTGLSWPEMENYSPIGSLVPREDIGDKVQFLLPTDSVVVIDAISALTQRVSGVLKINGPRTSLLKKQAERLTAEFLASSEKESYVFAERADGIGLHIKLFKTAGGEIAVSVFSANGTPIQPQQDPHLFSKLGHSIDAKVVLLGEAAVFLHGISGAFQILKNALKKTKGLASNELGRFDEWKAEVQRNIQARGILSFYLETAAKKGVPSSITEEVASLVWKTTPTTIPDLKTLIEGVPVPAWRRFIFDPRKALIKAIDAHIADLEGNEFGEKYGDEYHENFKAMTQEGGEMLVTLHFRLLYRLDAEGNIEPSIEELPSVSVAAPMHTPTSIVNQRQIDQFAQTVLHIAKKAARALRLKAKKKTEF